MQVPQFIYHPPYYHASQPFPSIQTESQLPFSQGPAQPQPPQFHYSLPAFPQVAAPQLPPSVPPSQPTQQEQSPCPVQKRGPSIEQVKQRLLELERQAQTTNQGQSTTASSSQHHQNDNTAKPAINFEHHQQQQQQQAQQQAQQRSSQRSTSAKSTRLKPHMRVLSEVYSKEEGIHFYPVIDPLQNGAKYVMCAYCKSDGKLFGSFETVKRHLRCCGPYLQRCKARNDAALQRDIAEFNAQKVLTEEGSATLRSTPDDSKDFRKSPSHWFEQCQERKSDATQNTLSNSAEKFQQSALDRLREIRLKTTQSTAHPTWISRKREAGGTEDESQNVLMETDAPDGSRGPHGPIGQSGNETYQTKKSAASHEENDQFRQELVQKALLSLSAEENETCNNETTTATYQDGRESTEQRILGNVNNHCDLNLTKSAIRDFGFQNQDEVLASKPGNSTFVNVAASAVCIDLEPDEIKCEPQSDDETHFPMLRNSCMAAEAKWGNFMLGTDNKQLGPQGIVELQPLPFTQQNGSSHLEMCSTQASLRSNSTRNTVLTDKAPHQDMSRQVLPTQYQRNPRWCCQPGTEEGVCGTRFPTMQRYTFHNSDGSSFREYFKNEDYPKSIQMQPPKDYPFDLSTSQSHFTNCFEDTSRVFLEAPEPRAEIMGTDRAVNAMACYMQRDEMSDRYPKHIVETANRSRPLMELETASKATNSFVNATTARNKSSTTKKPDSLERPVKKKKKRRNKDVKGSLAPCHKMSAYLVKSFGDNNALEPSPVNPPAESPNSAMEKQSKGMRYSLPPPPVEDALMVLSERERKSVLQREVLQLNSSSAEIKHLDRNAGLPAIDAVNTYFNALVHSQFAVLERTAKLLADIQASVTVLQQPRPENYVEQRMNAQPAEFRRDGPSEISGSSSAKGDLLPSNDLNNSKTSSEKPAENAARVALVESTARNLKDLASLKHRFPLFVPHRVPSRTQCVYCDEKGVDRVLCEACGRMMHMACCLGPAVRDLPDNDWICSDCSAKGYLLNAHYQPGEVAWAWDCEALWPCLILDGMREESGRDVSPREQDMGGVGPQWQNFRYNYFLLFLGTQTFDVLPHSKLRDWDVGWHQWNCLSAETRSYLPERLAGLRTALRLRTQTHVSLSSLKIPLVGNMQELQRRKCRTFDTAKSGRSKLATIISCKEQANAPRTKRNGLERRCASRGSRGITRKDESNDERYNPSPHSSSRSLRRSGRIKILNSQKQAVSSSCGSQQQTNRCLRSAKRTKTAASRKCGSSSDSNTSDDSETDPTMASHRKPRRTRRKVAKATAQSEPPANGLPLNVPNNNEMVCTRVKSQSTQPNATEPKIIGECKSSACDDASHPTKSMADSQPKKKAILQREKVTHTQVITICDKGDDISESNIGAIANQSTISGRASHTPLTEIPIPTNQEFGTDSTILRPHIAAFARRQDNVWRPPSMLNFSQCPSTSFLPPSQDTNKRRILFSRPTGLPPTTGCTSVVTDIEELITEEVTNNGAKRSSGTVLKKAPSALLKKRRTTTRR